MLDDFEIYKANVLDELEIVEKYINSIRGKWYYTLSYNDEQIATIKKVRQALVDAKAFFEAMVDEITE